MGPWTGEAEAGKVYAETPVVVLQFVYPAVPGVKGGKGAVEEYQRRARTFIAVVDAHSIDVDESGCVCRERRFQLPAGKPGLAPCQ